MNLFHGGEGRGAAAVDSDAGRELLPDDAARKSHAAGWIGLIDKLPAFLGDAA